MMRAYLLSALLIASGTAVAGWEYTSNEEAPLTRAELNQYDLTLPADGTPAAIVPTDTVNVEYGVGAVPRPHMLIRYTPRRKTLLDASGRQFLSPMLFGSGFLDSEQQP